MNDRAFDKILNDWKRGDTLQVLGQFKQWNDSMHKHPGMVPTILTIRNTYRIKPSEE